MMVSIPPGRKELFSERFCAACTSHQAAGITKNVDQTFEAVYKPAVKDIERWRHILISANMHE